MNDDKAHDGAESVDAARRCGGDPGGGCRGGPLANVVPLSALVRSEAIRNEAGERLRPDPARLAAGWEKRFAIERARAADLVRLYEEAGYEVAMDPVAPERLADECGDCRIVAGLDFVLVYTRRAEPPAGSAPARAGNTPQSRVRDAP